MISTRQAVYLITRALPSYLGLAILYTVLIFILPVDRTTASNYNMSALEYHILYFLVALPAIFTWGAAFLGYAKLFDYADSIKDTSEGVHFKKLSRGVAWLAWSLPITSIVALILSGIANAHTGFHPASVILSNYLHLSFPLIAFTLIGTAARGLMTDSKLQLGTASTRAIMLTFVTVGVSYCYLVFRHFSHNSLGSADNPYFLPIWLMVLTVAIPYLYAWFVGLLAAYEISMFGSSIDGHLYRKGILALVSGLVIVIATSIILQYMGSIGSKTGHLILSGKLLLVLFFRIIRGVGFLLLAWGAIRLKKIEEV